MSAGQSVRNVPDRNMTELSLDDDDDESVDNIDVVSSSNTSRLCRFRHARTTRYVASVLTTAMATAMATTPATAPIPIALLDDVDPPASTAACGCRQWKDYV